MAKDKELKDVGANGRRMTALERAVQTALGEGRVIGADDDPARESMPALWEWLSTLYPVADRVKNPATIMITLAPGGVLANMNDRDLGYAVSASSKHLKDIFQALEDALTSDVPPIRSYGKKEPNLRKRNKQ